MNYRRDTRDANESRIIKWLVSAGATVEKLPPGNGRPDLLVGFRGRNYLLEVKTEKGRIRPEQESWHSAWNGDVHVVRTPQEAIAAIGITAG